MVCSCIATSILFAISISTSLNSYFTKKIVIGFDLEYKDIKCYFSSTN